MKHDVFSGDADGICALHQLRLAFPATSNLISGLKRETSLLQGVESSPGDEVTVLNLALSSNRDALLAMLDKGVNVRYFDHHVSEDIPGHPNLNAMIDSSSGLCTSLLVNRHLSGKYLIWAVIGAFGENLRQAYKAAEPLCLLPPQLTALRELGEHINYNSNGESVNDAFFHPAELYRIMHRHADPFVFIRDDGVLEILKQGYIQDMALARAVRPEHETQTGIAYILPNKPWGRRVSRAYCNTLAGGSFPDRAHAVLMQRGDGTFLVNVRAPLTTNNGADILCSRFATGSGVKETAEINRLPENELPRFMQAFDEAFSAAT